ncbi:MAG: haloacid dehalogenase [Flavobacteriaceae bacterium]|nr:MAG: haloacid dehalogenase [Flavobacteriaceae bacterium]
MDLSKIKMVVTDMDGTLLNSNHEVSSKFYTLFEELKKRDIIFVAASGRQYGSIIEKLHPIKDDIIVIAENGGFAMHKDVELISTPLDRGVRNEVLQILDPVENIHTVLCGKRNAYIKGDSDEFIQMLKQFYSEFEIVDDLSQVDTEILKIAVYHFESSEKYIYPKVQHLEDQLKVKVSGPNWVDLSSENANKGYALQKLQHKYDIAPNETLVFGDYNNDLEMLACADYSFAMANAHPNVLKVANYKTLSNDENGVEYILEHVLGLK